MSVDCHCHPNWYECPVLYFGKPNYPVPAIPLRIEYVFGYGLNDGIFVRQDDYIVCGAYLDGMPVESCLPIPYEYEYVYPDID